MRAVKSNYIQGIRPVLVISIMTFCTDLATEFLKSHKILIMVLMRTFADMQQSPRARLKTISHHCV